MHQFVSGSHLPALKHLIKKSVIPQFLGKSGIRSLVLLASLFWQVGCSQSDQTGPAIKSSSRPRSYQPLDIGPSGELLAEKLVLIEDLTLDLTFRLKELATWLTLPTQGRSAPDFHHLMECHGAEIIDDARLNDLLGQTATPNTFGGSAFRWPLGALPAWNEHVTNPLTGMFQLVAKFDSIKFGVLYSNFTSDDRTKFKMRTKLAAKASIDQGTGESVVGVSGKQDLSWEFQGGVWNLVGWKSIELKVITSQSAMFEDITEKCLPDKDTFNQAQRSRHFELITETTRMTIYSSVVAGLQLSYCRIKATERSRMWLKNWVFPSPTSSTAPLSSI